MNALLWKDYRQSRRFLIAAGVFLALPYTLVILFTLGELLAYGHMRGVGLVQRLHGAAIGSLGVSALLTAFVAGNAIAGERVDRSAEFAAQLPISRRSAIASKALLAIGVCLCFWLINISIYFLTYSMLGDWPAPVKDELVVALVVASVLVFGVSWLFSALLSSPAIAAASGLGSVMILFMVIAIVEETQGLRVDAVAYVHALACVVLGTVCFVAGVLHCLHRVEP